MAADDAQAPQAAQAPATEEIVVTGSRIIRDGYEAPTPVSVLSAEALAAQSSTGNIADTINTMPVFANSTSPTSTAGVPSFGTNGINSLNLRNLGVNRTLVLLDGQRVSPVLSNGTVDIDNFPQGLISRVDVVTGGASAVYGSDAVAGVVNFILDKNFVGVKGEVSGGITGFGDDQSFLVQLSGGMPFAGDRGHILIAGEIMHNNGVLLGAGGRRWSFADVGLVENPAYNATCGCPEIITRPHVYFDNATHGGIIISGPLKGTAFGQNGVPYQFNYGIIGSPGDPFMQGGDWQSTLTTEQANSLDTDITRQTAYFRASYDLTDNVNVYASASWGATTSVADAFPHYSAGTAGPVILSGNPFIPATIQAQMTALKIPQFQVGTMNWDMGAVWSHVVRAVNRYSFGANGKVDAFDTPWTWNAYLNYGYTRTSYYDNNVEDTARLKQAEDAVLNANGQIVCRVALTNPNTGCVPWNPLGVGVNDPNGAAKKWIFGAGFTNEHIGQTAVGASITGEPFSDWAGPVSVALDAEWRRDSALGKPNATSIAAGWRSGNYGPIDAHRQVIEGAGEVVVPLAKNTSFAEQWDLNAGVRGTNYSYSGYVTTWKAGTTYAPIADVRLRATRSRDIRAPSLNEAFGLGNNGLGSSPDPFTNSSPTFSRPIVGNPNLQPEKADSTDVGVVFQPRFLPDFSFSVDYWNIDLKSAIVQIPQGTILNLCYTGNQQFCSYITRTPIPGAPPTAYPPVTVIQLSFFNAAVQTVRGLDFESSYKFALGDLVQSWNGNITLHGNASVNIKNYTNNGFSPPTDNVGQVGAQPYWRINASVNYTLDAFSTTFTARAFSAGHRNNTYVECTTGCPVSTANFPTIDSNYAPGAFYLDASFNYTFTVGDNTRLQTFLNIKNLMDKDPGYIPQRGLGGLPQNSFPTSIGYYDTLGRVFRAGVKFKM